MKATELFRDLTRALDECEISYMLTGLFASNVYGMGRGTMDVDLVVSATVEQIKKLSTLLSEPGITLI
jgi:hypothetical protein